MIPNLFISGAAKSGTTYIYDFLNIQKNVHMSPIKEPQFFSLLLTENFSKKNYLSNKGKKYLFSFFEDDIKKVESLISRDLSIWSH